MPFAVLIGLRRSRAGIHYVFPRNTPGPRPSAAGAIGEEDHGGADADVESLRYQDSDRVTLDFVSRIAEQLFHPRIDQYNLAALIDDDHGVGRRFHQRANLSSEPLRAVTSRMALDTIGPCGVCTGLRLISTGNSVHPCRDRTAPDRRPSGARRDRRRSNRNGDQGVWSESAVETGPQLLSDDLPARGQRSVRTECWPAQYDPADRPSALRRGSVEHRPEVGFHRFLHVLSREPDFIPKCSS